MKKYDYLKYQRKNPLLFPIGGDFRPDRADAFAVIPALAEDFQALSETLDSLDASARSGNLRCSALVVVNAPENAPEAWKNANCVLLEKLARAARPGVGYLHAPGLPASHGVGGARKIGMDAVISALPFEEERILFSLDADTVAADGSYLPGTLDAFARHPDWEGAVFGFRHRTEGKTPEIRRAIAEYENYIRHYRDRLKYAGSPYAYASIGSAFAVRSHAYVRAGGMRKRSAGEDFYFLQALRKCGKIGELENILVRPDARVSTRTPFGTGRTLEKSVNGMTLRFFPDESFEILRQVLRSAERLAGNDGVPRPERGREFVRALPEAAAGFFEGFPERWEEMCRHGNRDGFAFHRFFDGLKTLQFVKYVSAKLETPQ